MPRRDTPTLLLDAAERSFEQDSYAAVRLEDIAAAVGIRAPSLLYHFASKEILYEAVVARMFDALRETFAAVMARPPEPFRIRFEALLDSYVGFVEARPAFARIVLREIANGHGPARSVLVEWIGPMLDFVEAWVRRAGGSELAPGAPVRAVLGTLAASALVRASAGPDLGEELWPDGDPTVAFAGRLLGLDTSNRD